MVKLSDVVRRIVAGVKVDPGLESTPPMNTQEAYEAMMRVARDRVLLAMGIPARVVEVLRDPRETDLVKRARLFVDSRQDLLVLAGGLGCGKSVAAAAALAAYVVVDPWSVRRAGKFFTAIHLARAGTFDAEFWAILDLAPMLVIDDLGTEPLDERGWAHANLQALLDDRFGAKRKTILTTNLRPDQFRERYGERIWDRLRESGAFYSSASESLRG